MNCTAWSQIPFIGFVMILHDKSLSGDVVSRFRCRRSAFEFPELLSKCRYPGSHENECILWLPNLGAGTLLKARVGAGRRRGVQCVPCMSNGAELSACCGRGYPLHGRVPQGVRLSRDRGRPGMSRISFCGTDDRDLPGRDPS